MGYQLRWRTLSNGSQTAYADIYDQGTKKRIRRSLDIKIAKNSTNKRELKERAKKAYEELINQYKKHRLGEGHEVKRASSFKEYCDNYLKGYNRPGRRKYIYSVKKFEKYISSIGKKPEKISFTDITPQLLEGFKVFLYDLNRSGLSGETPYDFMRRFKTILIKATEERYFDTNPMTMRLQKPKSQLKKQILTKDELQVLASTPCSNDQIKRAFLFACLTGLGEKEIKQLTWKNLADQRLTTNRAKNENFVGFKLSKSAIDLAGPKGAREEKVFDLPSNTAVAKSLKKWITDAKIDKHITFYCGRHSFAILHLTNGTDLQTISKLMGHSSIEYTIKYLNFLDDLKDQAMDNLPELELI